MLSVLLITFPFFALVLCGYLAARGGVLPQPAIPGLNAFVLLNGSEIKERQEARYLGFLGCCGL